LPLPDAHDIVESSHGRPAAAAIPVRSPKVRGRGRTASSLGRLYQVTKAGIATDPFIRIARVDSENAGRRRPERTRPELVLA